ncbi:MAG: hypothetical protein V1905_01810 [bacterium]
MEKESLILSALNSGLMDISGNVKGEVFHTYKPFICYRKGEDGIRQVEERMKAIGYPMVFKDIKSTKWYPEALSVLTIIVACEIFNWDEGDIFEMGKAAPKYSGIVKFMIRYFLSPRKTFDESPKYWRRHFDFGKIENAVFDEKNKTIVIHIMDYKFHPLICAFHRGYFFSFTQLTIKSDCLKVEETKCAHRGDKYHEFTIKW